MMEEWDDGILEEWDDGILEEWDDGILEWKEGPEPSEPLLLLSPTTWAGPGRNGMTEEWKNGMMEEWNDGRMEEWKNGMMEDWKNGMVNIGMGEGPEPSEPLLVLSPTTWKSRGGMG